MTVQYYMVMTSLPRVSRNYKIEEPPISRVQLEKRLKLLPPERMQLLFNIEFLLWKSWFKPKQTVAQTNVFYHHLVQENSIFITRLMGWIFNIRSIFAAMRMRITHSSIPENAKEYWVIDLASKLIKNWNEPDFGLKSTYPWATKISHDLLKRDTVAVEEFLLDYIWKHLALIETGHYFDFEALVIYVMRWNIINYWSKFSKVNALDNIDDLINSFLVKG